MDTPIPYGRQHITEEDIAAVVAALQSDYMTQGPRIGEFERAFAAYIGCKYAVAVANGTAALHIAAMAMNVKAGDKVITTPITFSASANCVRYCGGEVVFGDIDPATFLLDIESVRRILEEDTERTIKGIIPVDFAGRAVNLEAFRQLADEYGVWIIEDACHAPGGFFTDSKGVEQWCGNSHYADLAIFSFHPVKHIACGEGGMVTTNDEELYKQLNRLRSHGITKGDDVYTNDKVWAGSDDKSFPGWYMELQQLGYNYRLTDLQCALGISQLKRADEGLIRRRIIAARYESFFADKDYVIRQTGVVHGHAYHLYVVEVKDRYGLYKYLRSHNIFAQIHYIPVHLMPYYKSFGWKEGDMPHAESYYRHCISLPMYPTLTEEQQAFVLNTIEQYYQ